MSFEQFILDNDKLLWAIISNKDKKYFNDYFHENLLKHFDKEDLYQELLTKIHSVYPYYNNDKGVLSTYIVVICKHHIITLMQPYKSKKKKDVEIESDYDFTLISDNIDYETLYENKMTMQEILDILKTYKHKEVIELILQGESQSDIAKQFNVSRQSISHKYLNFIKKVKEEL